jgi:hypothetical protein
MAGTPTWPTKSSLCDAAVDSNVSFLIGKRTFREALANDHFWPIPAIGAFNAGTSDRCGVFQHFG